MSERLKKWKREQLQRLSKDMPATYHDVGMLLKELEAVERERDEAREAAIQLLCVARGRGPDDTDDNDIALDEALERWPWLEETQ